MKKNFGKAGAFLTALLLTAALVFLGCDSSSSDDGDSKSGTSAAVSPVEQDFIPESGANYLSVKLVTGAFRDDVKISDFSFGETRSSTFGANLGAARLTIVNKGTTNNRVIITGIKASANDAAAGKQTLTVKASALALPATGVQVETGSIGDVVVGPFYPSLTDASVLSVTLSGGGRFVDSLAISDFELLQKDSAESGKYALYSQAYGFTRLDSNATITRDSSLAVRFSGLTKITAVDTAGTGTYLWIKPSAQAEAFLAESDKSILNTHLPDGTNPRYSNNAGGSFEWGRAVLQDPEDWIGSIGPGKTKVTVDAYNATFKPKEQLLPGYFSFENVATGFKLDPGAVTFAVTSTTVNDGTGTSNATVSRLEISGLKAPTGDTAQLLRVSKNAFASYNPNISESFNGKMTIDAYADAKTIITSAHYTMQGQNLLTLELPRGKFVPAAAIAKEWIVRGATNSAGKIGGVSNADTARAGFEAEAIPASDPAYPNGWEINLLKRGTQSDASAILLFTQNAVTKANLEATKVEIATGTGTFASATAVFGAFGPAEKIARIRLSADLAKMELFSATGFGADTRQGSAGQGRSTISINSAIVASAPNGLSVTTGNEALKVPVTFTSETAGATANSIRIGYTATGTGTPSVLKAVSRTAAWPVANADGTPAGTVAVRAADDGAAVYATGAALVAGQTYYITTNLPAGNTYFAAATADGETYDATADDPVAFYGLDGDNLPSDYTAVWAWATNETDVAATLPDGEAASTTKAGDNTLVVTVSGTFRGWDTVNSVPFAYDVGNLVRLEDFVLNGAPLKTGTLVLVSETEARIYNTAVPAGAGTLTVKSAALALTADVTATFYSGYSFGVSGIAADAAFSTVLEVSGATWAVVPDGTTPNPTEFADLISVIQTADPQSGARGGDTKGFALLNSAAVSGTVSDTAWADVSGGTAHSRITIAGTAGAETDLTGAYADVSARKVYFTIWNNVANNAGLVRDGTSLKITQK